MKHFLLFYLITHLFLLIGCEYKSDKNLKNIKTLVLEYNFESDRYEINKTQITSLKNPRKLKSHIANFYYNKNEIQSLKKAQPLTLNLVKGSSDLYLPEDIASLTAVSAYKTYELLWQHHSKLGIESYSVWPKQVVLLDQKQTVEVNNAIHISGENKTFYLPFESNDLPAHLNPGLIAHEESHGLFHEIVIKGLMSDNEIEEWNALLSKEYKLSSSEELFAMNEQRLVEYNYTFLRVLNEGIADFMGYTFTNVPDFILRSFSFEQGSELRFNRIVGKSMMAPLPSVDQLQLLINNIKNVKSDTDGLHVKYLLPKSEEFQDQVVVELNTTSLLSLSYRLSGLVSTMLNIISENIPQDQVPQVLTKKEYLLQKVVTSLPKFRLILNKKLKTQRLSFNDLWSVLLDEKIINQDICSAIKNNWDENQPIEGCNSEE